MNAEPYVRPIGLLYGAVAREAMAQGKAGSLAGGPSAFTQAEIISGAPGATRSEIAAYTELAGTREAAIAGVLERISAPRPPLAGLSLDRPRIMGVVNVTPDSFSDGGLYNETEIAVSHAARLVVAGADIIDVGGESTRPGAEAVDRGEEMARVVPVLEGVRGVDALISIDTRRASVMRAAADAGADIINDVSALSHDADSMAAARDTGLPVVLMHAQGDPRTMQRNPTYDDVLLEVYDYLSARIEACEAAGLPRQRLIADPGIGFGKTIGHNLTLLAGLSLLHGLGVPLLLGVSRKSFIGTLTNEPDPAARDTGSVAAVLACVAQGVQIVRVHEAAVMSQALGVWRAATFGAVAAPGNH